MLAVLPLSFDYGMNQLTTAFLKGATAVLLNYLLPRDIVNACAREKITGLACVPPLWVQLAQLNWPAEAAQSLRYFTNSGGHMPSATLAALRQAEEKSWIERDLRCVRPTVRGFDFLSDLQALFLPAHG